jgi:putative membrane-bound dehydrogenase-like protein
MIRLAPLWFVVALVLSTQAADLVPVNALGLRVARGFRVSLFADSSMADDIYSMTLDPRGNVVVTGPGYIRTLRDLDNDGVADSVTSFAETRTGGMGMCFDGANFYFVGDGALLRYTDNDGDGVADGPPQQLLALDFLEHGGHAIRKGPDGWWYLIAGNETRFTNQHYSLAGSPIVRPEAGALLRLTPDVGGSEVIAEGFRNPYDFDFNAMGDLFTYDSDVESDFLLPWYTPTRIYHIAHGGHHGWRLPGWRRSWNRPDYYADTVNVLAAVGRGSPTGMACYRHYQFPVGYQNGIFALDWTFGRVYFLPATSVGATYAGTPEVFLEPIGTQGFAPNDIVVTQDGSLLVSIGGRKTRGGVYRISYGAERSMAAIASNWWIGATTETEAVLYAPQPLDAWSRAYWVPVAARLGRAPFLLAATDNRVAWQFRTRAIEVMTELHQGLPPDAAATLARATAPEVRARTAWSIGRAPPENYAALLRELSRDANAGVRRCALEALLDRAGNAGDVLLDAATANLAHADRRVRQAAARIAARLSPAAWNTLWNTPGLKDAQARLTAILALLWREGAAQVHVAAADAAISTLRYSQNADNQLDAIRLIILAMGDWNLYQPSVEVYTGYEPALTLQRQEALIARIEKAVRPLVATGNANVDFEAARLLAMIRDNAQETSDRVLLKITQHTTAASDFHFLTVLSRLSAPFNTNVAARLANSILAMDRKLEGQQLRPKQNWSLRLAEVVAQLVEHFPPLADAILEHPSFGNPSHVTLVPSLGPEKRTRAARLFLIALSKRPNFVWTPQLIDLLSVLPPAEVYPVFRKQWNNLALRDHLLLKLAAKPEPVDREKFLIGLNSAQSDVIIAAAGALMELPPNATGTYVLPIVRALQRHLTDTKEQPLRSLLLTLLKHQTGEAFNVRETAADAAEVKRAYQPVFAWFRKKFPTLVQYLEPAGTDVSYWTSLLPTIPWDKGDAGRGEILFQNRGCQTCHASTTPVGPDLAGVPRRLSRSDLLIAIVDPSREIAAPYRSTTFQMRSGESYTGVVVFESPDGVIVQTSASTTVRLSESDILSRSPSDTSLMPTGLLTGLSRGDLADLCAYLGRLAPQ